jgi:hypothetical protein
VLLPWFAVDADALDQDGFEERATIDGQQRDVMCGAYQACGYHHQGVHWMMISIMKRVAAAAALSAALASVGASARAEEGGDANVILKAMSDYVTSQKSITAAFNTDIEVVTPELQKIQFASSGAVQLTRPDKLHVSRTGGYTDVELFFDGKTFAVENKKDNAYAQTEAAGTVDQLIDKLRNESGVDMPGADILLSNPYAVLSADVMDAKHIGRGVINGVECEHLAFRNLDTDWQIWVETGAKPIPRKFVITSKAVTGGPQYTLLITDWQTDAPIAADAFMLHAPAGMKKMEFKDLSDIDEVPPGVVKGSKQ